MYKDKARWINFLYKALVIGVLTALFKITFVKIAFGGFGSESSALDVTFLTTEILDALVFVFLFEVLRRRAVRKNQTYARIV